MTRSASFDLEAMDDGSFYRHPSSQMQRRTLVHRADTREDSLTVQVDVVEIIHGTVSPYDSHPATLVITEFRFISPKKSGRFQSVVIKYRFASPHDSESDPEVFEIAPTGSLSIVPSQKDFIPSGMGISSSAVGVPVIAGTGTGSSATIGDSWEVVKNDLRKPGGATLVGAINLEGRNYGEPNTATWALIEDDVRKDGIPTLLRTAVLLRHEAKEPFTATVEVDATADMAYELRRLSGRTPKDPPITFEVDLNLPPNNDLALNLSDRNFVWTPETVSDGQYGKGPKAKTPMVVGGDASGGQASRAGIGLDIGYGGKASGKAPKLRGLTACTDYLLQVLQRLQVFQRIFTVSAKKVMGAIVEKGNKGTC
jgi:hypothetical protein